MSPAKVTLSQKELELVVNSDWILTKNAIIVKVCELFGGLSEAYGAELKKHPALLFREQGFLSPKISKGEQYRQLPWVMLDHPRYFTAADQFAIRSFFWWGNCCSLTLQLMGSFAETYAASIGRYFETHPQSGWFINATEDPWQHHFEADNYQLMEQVLPPFEAMPVIKLAKKTSLGNWEQLPEFFLSNYREILEMLES